MGLLSTFKRRIDPRSSDAAAVSAPGDAVQQARTRARRRLIGAAVLVVIGIVGFPLVFETQPRPIPVDIPIELPRKETAPPLAMPAGRSLGIGTTASAPRAEPAPAASQSEVITESRADAGREVVAPSPASAPVAAPPARAASSVVAAAPAAEKPVAKAALEPKSAPPVTDGARAKALLDGKPASRDEAARFVVQVGAFADAGAARETRLKVERLGLKTYTQVASTSQGDRIRVRVGPFGTRDEADKAMAKARTAGLTAVVLTL